MTSLSAEASLLMPSPVGELVLVASRDKLRAVAWLRPGEVVMPARDPPQVLLVARRQLQEYFDGQRTVFDLPLDPQGTAFQRHVWRVMRQIKFGETWSYQRVAEAAGRSTATRAVGSCAHRNPIPIIVPCHRVIRADGSLGGFARGCELKRALLQAEQRPSQPKLGSTISRRFLDPIR